VKPPLWVFLVLALLLSSASTQAALICWDTNFDDTFRVEAEQSPEDGALFALTAVHWQGLNVYQMSGATSAHLFVTTPNVVNFTAYMDNLFSAFGNNPTCRFRVGLFLDTLGGGWTMDCTGGPGMPFTVSGTATRQDPCPADNPVGVAQAQRITGGKGLAGLSH
jgi:hypothetical protein